ncbi:MAG: hypothetical protein Q7V63_07405 [Gammaproteobacteria bacterium]|nr:hypothetical protein [Gammaproteobacteria bacterium]
MLGRLIVAFSAFSGASSQITWISKGGFQGSGNVKFSAPEGTAELTAADVAKGDVVGVHLQGDKFLIDRVSSGSASIVTEERRVSPESSSTFPPNSEAPQGVSATAGPFLSIAIDDKGEVSPTTTSKSTYTPE